MIDAPQRPAQPPPSSRLPRLIAACRTWAAGPLRRSRWLILSCVALVALAFLSHPGLILADTKLDLAVNPYGFIARAFQLWDPSQFGQLQDQAVGYVFPVGLLFAAGKLLVLPGWVMQRVWIAGILLAAFLGTVRLCTRLGIGTPATRIAAGFGYALAPNALSTLGTLSSEILPIAMLPWILIPLVRAVQAGPRMSAGGHLKAAAQSAVAVALCSGINAAAAFAVLIPPVIYLLTAARPAARWRIMAWWLPAVLLAISWWLIPLLLQDAYGASILPYTESAAITTAHTGLFNTLRGTENWITYLVVNSKPWEPVAFRISTEALPTILTGLIAGLGLTGLVSRRMPDRRFLLCALLAGIVIVVAGYVSTLGNPLAPAVDHIINGPLAPFRNLRKFDPLIRLPIALGLANLLASVRLRRPQVLVGLVAAGAVGLLALPVYVSGLGMAGSFSTIPGYWVSAATWLNQHAGNQGILEEPGARFGQYTWGSPMDDVLQPLVNGNWASVQVSDLGSVGNMRLLQAIDQQMTTGNGSPGLTALLAEMGVKYIVVRNDLARDDLYGAWPARIHQALAESPGIVKVAQFGSVPVGDTAPGNAISSLDAPYPPVQIYRVDGADPIAIVQPTADTMRVFGAPEALLALANDNVLQNRPVLLNSDAPQIRARYTVITDSLRRRVRNFGEIRIDYSPTLTATQPLTTFDVATDFLEPGWARYEAVAKYYGVSNVKASTADSSIEAVPSQSGTGRLPFAAIDGNLATMWESGSHHGAVGQWIRISFVRRLNPGTISVAFADNSAIGPPVTRVEVTTAAGRVTDPVSVTGSFQSLRVPAGPSRWLQITVKAVRRQRKRPPWPQVGIKEISIPGMHASRTIEAPVVNLPGGADPSAVVLAKAEPQPSGCMLTSARWVCSPELERATEEQYGFDESFAIQNATTAKLSGTAVVTSPALIAAYAFPGRQQPSVTASSTYTADPEDQAFSAFDGNPLTTWISGASDARPTLTVHWHGSREVGRITILRPPGVSSTLPVRITGSAGQVRTGTLARLGRSSSWQISFTPMKTSSLTLSFTPKRPPVQITEVEIPGVRPLSAAGATRIMLPCGSGPAIMLDGTHVPTQAAGSTAALLDGQPIAFSACSDVGVASGWNQVVEPSSDGFSVQSVAIDRIAPGLLSAGPAGPAAPAKVLSWTTSQRVVRVTATQRSYLIVAENFNAGWQARLDGRVLMPVQLDGWQQGWVLPAGSNGNVTLSYLPQGPFLVSVLGGLAAVVVIMIIAFVPLRRRRVRRAEASPDSSRVPQASPHAAQMPAPGSATAGSATAGSATAGAATAAEPVTPVPAAPSAATVGTASRPTPAGVAPVAAEVTRLQRFTGPDRPFTGLPDLVFAAGLVLTAFLGLWTGGDAGALLLSAGTAVFVIASAHAANSELSRVLTSRWLVAGLLVAASVFAVLGTYVAGSAGFVNVLSGTFPELLCLAIIARLVAALLLTFAAGQDSSGADEGRTADSEPRRPATESADG